MTLEFVFLRAMPLLHLNLVLGLRTRKHVAVTIRILSWLKGETIRTGRIKFFVLELLIQVFTAMKVSFKNRKWRSVENSIILTL